MAIRTSTSSARSSSYSTQKAPQKPSSAQRSSSNQRASTPTQNRQTSSAPRRDTFTYSSPTAKQTAPKTSTAKTATTTKSTSAASNKNRDTFTYTSPAAKTAVKNNASNKIAVSGSLSKNKTKSAQNTVPDGLKLHLKHTTDPKQKAAMQKTMKNISNGISSEKADNSSLIIPNDYTSPRVTSNVKGLQENTPLTPKLGRVWGPAGEETFYNMVMNRENGESVIGYMREAGFSEKDYPYWVRDDGVKMLGDYVVVAANLDIRPRGSVIDTSLGKALICDTGSFTEENPEQIDIAVNWGKCINGTDSFYKTDPRKKS